MYQEFFMNYYQQNKSIIVGNCLLTIFIFPIEIIALSWISGMIFYTIKNKEKREFYKYVMVFFFVFVSILLLYYASERFDSYILPGIQESIRNDIYQMVNDKKIGSSPCENGELILKLLKIPNYVFVNFMNSVTFMIPLVFSIFFFICYMFYIHWKIGVTSFIFFSVFCSLFVYYYLKFCKISNDRFNKETDTINEFEDVIKNNQNIILNNSQKFEEIRLFKKEKELQKEMENELLGLNNFKIIFILALVIFMVGIIFYCSYMTIHEQLNIYKLIILTTATLLMVRSFTNLIRRSVDSIVEFGPALIDVDFLQKIQKSQIHFGHQKDFFKNFTIRLKDITYKKNDKEIIHPLSLEIPFPSSILITGAIGSGKTTLLRLLSGFIMPSSGEILFDGMDSKDIDIEYLRENMNYMHQNVILFKRSVLENIFYKIEKSSREWLDGVEILKKLSIYPQIKHFLDTKDATTLSGGQKQIVLLLRCFFRNVKIVLLDEPTANLDPQIKSIILDLIHIMKKSRTIICVSHDKELKPYFEKHYDMSQGTLKVIRELS